MNFYNWLDLHFQLLCSNYWKYKEPDYYGARGWFSEKVLGLSSSWHSFAVAIVLSSCEGSGITLSVPYTARSGPDHAGTAGRCGCAMQWLKNSWTKLQQDGLRGQNKWRDVSWRPISLLLVPQVSSSKLAWVSLWGQSCNSLFSTRICRYKDKLLVLPHGTSGQFGLAVGEGNCCHSSQPRCTTTSATCGVDVVWITAGVLQHR